MGGKSGGGGGNADPFYGAGMTPAESQALATVSGGSAAPNVASPTAATPYAPAQLGSPNINQMAAQGIMGAGAATAANMGYRPQTLAGTNMAQYMNPYTEQVIAANEADILRGAQKGINALDTAAGRAGAFGGSRHGVALGELGTGVAQQLAQSSAGLRQAGFQNAQQAAQYDIGMGLQGQQARLNAAQQLGNIAQQGFGMGQTVQQNLMQQGQQQQAMQQALLDAAKAQFQGYVNQPLSSLGFVSAALGATPTPMQSQQTKQLGLMDYLTAASTAAGMFPKSDIRLKKSIKKVGELANGLGVYTWEWKDKIKSMSGNFSMTKGVMAQEAQKVIPDAVIKGADGYLMVDYSHPELQGAV